MASWVKAVVGVLRKIFSGFLHANQNVAVAPNPQIGVIGSAERYFRYVVHASILSPALSVHDCKNPLRRSTLLCAAPLCGRALTGSGPAAKTDDNQTERRSQPTPLSFPHESYS